MSVSLEGITRRFGSALALDRVDLAVREGEFVALLGPSGSGKTTLLRILAGLDFPDAGHVLVAGRDMSAVPARERGIGFVFQHYALFRHMTVFENVAFGLRVRPAAHRPAEAAIAGTVRGLLERMQIPELERRYPEQISGGQRQRVALARALAIEPRLLLLDEPFGALDAAVRKGLRRWLRDLHGEMGLTSLFVTHDQEEAMALADRVAVMRAGRIVQFDTASNLLERPASAFVAGFLSQVAPIAAVLEGSFLRFTELPLPPLERARLRVAPGEEGPVQIFVRPHEWAVAPGKGNAAVRACRPGGGRLHLELALGSRVIEAEVPEGNGLPPGAPCQLSVASGLAFSA